MRLDSPWSIRNLSYLNSASLSSFYSQEALFRFSFNYSILALKDTWLRELWTIFSGVFAEHSGVSMLFIVSALLLAPFGTWSKWFSMSIELFYWLILDPSLLSTRTRPAWNLFRFLSDVSKLGFRPKYSVDEDRVSVCCWFRFGLPIAVVIRKAADLGS